MREGVRGEEKWRWDGTGVPEGRLGEGRGTHTQRGNKGGHWEGGGWTMASVSPAHLGPVEPTEVLGLILRPPRHSPASWVQREWEGGRGEEK